MGRAEAAPPHTGGQGGERRPSVAETSSYRRRDPEKSLLHEMVRGHLKTFLDEPEQPAPPGADQVVFYSLESERDPRSTSNDG